MQPPRRLGSSMKFLLRASNGSATDLSVRNNRSSVLRAEARLTCLLMVTRTVWHVLRAEARLTCLLMVTRTVWPGFALIAMVISGLKRTGKYSEQPIDDKATVRADFRSFR